jgi:hypothetical protein
MRNLRNTRRRDADDKATTLETWLNRNAHLIWDKFAPWYGPLSGQPWHVGIKPAKQKFGLLFLNVFGGLLLNFSEDWLLEFDLNAAHEITGLIIDCEAGAQLVPVEVTPARIRIAGELIRWSDPHAGGKILEILCREISVVFAPHWDGELPW